MKTLYAIFFCLVVNSAFCQEKKIRGSWDNTTGQVLIFQKDQQALWIFYSESKRDTFRISYKTDFSGKPYKLDLSDFQVGPLKGKTLYGIVEFPDKKTMRFDCEPGISDQVRPKEFNPKQTQTYKKK